MYWLLTVLSWLFCLLPRRAALGLGTALGWIWYRLVPIRRTVALDNLRMAFPELPASERRRIARACFGQLGRSAVEYLRLPGLDRKDVDELIEHVGLEHLQRALAAGRGVIAVTGHFGNFDLMACAEALRGVPLHAITREQSLGGVNRFWMRVRARTGVGFLAAKGSALRIGRLLRQGRLVAVVIDQHMPPGRGIPVPFFGRLASTTHAPAVLALTTSAPILPVTVERLGAGRHRVRFEPVLQPVPSGDRQRDVERITLTLNRWLEERIRRRPDHWLWIHRRWKLAEPKASGRSSVGV